MQFSVTIDKICDHIGDNSSAMRTRVGQFVNWSQQDISTRIEGEFNRTSSYIQCSAPYTTGTVSITEGSATVAGTDTVWTSAMEGSKIRFSTDPEFYTIASVDSTISITLDQNYLGDDDADATYIIYQDIYSLASDAEKVIDISNPSNSEKLQYISNQQLDVLDPNPQSTGIPELWTDAGIDSNGYLQIQLYQPPDDNYVIYYRYRKRLTDQVADTNISEIPVKYHDLLYLGGLAQAYEYDNNPLATTIWTRYENRMNDMEKDIQTGSEDSVSTLKSSDDGGGVPTLRLPPSHFNN